MIAAALYRKGMMPDLLAADLDLRPLKRLGVNPGVVDLIEGDIERGALEDVAWLGVVAQPFLDRVVQVAGSLPRLGRPLPTFPVEVLLRFMHIFIPPHDRVGVDRIGDGRLLVVKAGAHHEGPHASGDVPLGRPDAPAHPAAAAEAAGHSPTGPGPRCRERPRTYTRSDRQPRLPSHVFSPKPCL